MAAVSAPTGTIVYEEVSQAELVWERFRRHRLALIGMITLSIVVLACILVPVLTPFDPTVVRLDLALKPPGFVDPWTNDFYILGTERSGRDFLTVLFMGGRTTLIVALLPTIAILAIGSILGGLAGYFGGWIDSLISRIAEFMSALPLLPAYLLAFRILRPSSEVEFMPDKIPAMIATVAGVFAMFGWMGIFRLVRGAMLGMRELDFVEAARALGASHGRIIFKHLLPNTVGPLTVAGTFALADFIIMESVLSYFGVGLRNPPIPSWGNLLVSAQEFAWFITNLNPWEDVRGFLILVPTLLVLITVLSINYIGDALRDAMDPHRDK